MLNGGCLKSFKYLVATQGTQMSTGHGSSIENIKVE
jgi:hypothetical protein